MIRHKNLTKITLFAVQNLQNKNFSDSFLNHKNYCFFNLAMLPLNLTSINTTIEQKIKK